MESTPNLDRFQGCLIGLALGDALGAPYEFSTKPKVNAKKFGRGYFGTKPGGATDDSTFALLLAGSLGTHGGKLQPVDYMARLLAWLNGNPPDVGAQTRKAVEYWRDHNYERNFIPADEEACGNGSLMACAPLGLAYAGKGLQAVAAGEEFSSLTHPSSRSKRAVGFVVQSISRLVVDPRDVPPLEAQIRMGGSLEATPIGFVLLTAGLAYRAACTAESVDQAFPELVKVIEFGGDTDTNAAVAGALLGARFGMDAWPPQLVAQLELRNEMLHEAERLFDLHAAQMAQ